METLYHQLLVPDYVEGFGLGESICQKHYVIGVAPTVIVCAGYPLLLFFASLKPFSFIKSIDVLSTLSKQMINRYEANVCPCSTPSKMSK